MKNSFNYEFNTLFLNFKYENVQKYNDAASTIQKKYRAYKSLSLSNAYHNQAANKITLNSLQHNSIDDKVESNKKRLVLRT